MKNSTNLMLVQFEDSEVCDSLCEFLSDICILHRRINPNGVLLNYEDFQVARDWANEYDFVMQYRDLRNLEMFICTEMIISDDLAAAFEDTAVLRLSKKAFLVDYCNVHRFELILQGAHMPFVQLSKDYFVIPEAGRTA